MIHPTEEALIAYQLGGIAAGGIAADGIAADGIAAGGIAGHLERCPHCARHAEEIARTLRVFSADPVPAPNLDHAWQRLRGSLPPVPVASERRRGGWKAASWLRFALPAAALLLPLLATVVAIGPRVRRHPRAGQPPSVASSGVLAPGPLSTQPQNGEIAAHLEDAERLLTAISHEAGPLDGTTRAQAERLLLRNAVYVRQARAAGDLPEASVLEDLGRTLTTLNHEGEAEQGWRFRMELNANGLLLDIRILQQNDAHPATAGPSR